jgi:RND family efflux transporter MFP subunit
MNMEAGISGIDAEEVDLEMRRRRRRIVTIAVAGVLLLLVAIWIWTHRNAETGAAPDATPRVSVVIPRKQQVATMVPAVGNIGARRDMPVGIAGEGGRVVRVLVEPGDWVKAGQTLAIIDRSVQSQQAAALAASIAQARADAALAKSNLERAKKLVGNGFISRADLEAKQAALDSANARVAVAAAQFNQQRAMIGRLDVVAPTGGLVLTRTVEAGQIVGGASGALFRIAENGAMEMQARLAEEDLAHLHAGSPATVTPIGTDLKVVGQVWQISPVIDPTSRQGTVRIALPFNEALRPGGFANAQIGGGQGNVPLLPEAAVMSDDKGNFVYLINKANQVERRTVTVGGVDDRGVTVTSGLNGTEKVVTSAGAFLHPGDKVVPMVVAAR